MNRQQINIALNIVCICWLINVSHVFAQEENYTLSFSSYLGSNVYEHARDIVFDKQNNFYVVGGTNSPNFPTTPGAYDRTLSTGGASLGSFGVMDIFISKFNINPTNGSVALVWSTFFGGPNYDRAYAVEVDKQGNVIIAGRAGEQFPVTQNAAQKIFAGDVAASNVYGKQDGFIAKFSSDGTQLLWSTYFGDDGYMGIRDIALDSQDNIYLVTGHETQRSYPVSIQTAFTKGFQAKAAGGIDTVIARLKSDGSQFEWASYMGGSNKDSDIPSVRVDNNDDVYVLSQTASNNIPTTSNAYDRTYNGSGDLFVFKVRPNLITGGAQQLLYATYLGGSGLEEHETHQLAVDSHGNAYVGCTTTSKDYPVTSGVVQASYGGGSSDQAISKLSTDGSTLLASTYYGGSGGDNLQGASIDLNGNFAFSGATSSPDYPTTFSALINTGINTSGVMVKLDSNLKNKLFSTRVGGSGNDNSLRAIEFSGSDLYAAGQTNSINWPLKNPYQSHNAGGQTEVSITGFKFQAHPGTNLNPAAPSNLRVVAP